MIYVADGGGYIGRELVRRLVRSGQRVRALVTGYLAPDRIGPAIDLVRILRIRRQREAGYRD